MNPRDPDTEPVTCCLPRRASFFIAVIPHSLLSWIEELRTCPWQYHRTKLTLRLGQRGTPRPSWHLWPSCPPLGCSFLHFVFIHLLPKSQCSDFSCTSRGICDFCSWCKAGLFSKSFGGCRECPFWPGLQASSGVFRGNRVDVRRRRVVPSLPGRGPGCASLPAARVQGISVYLSSVSLLLFGVSPAMTQANQSSQVQFSCKNSLVLIPCGM